MSEQNFLSTARPDLSARGVREVESSVDEARRRAAGLEGLARLRSRQLSDALHEFRSPLLAVSGYVKLLLKESAGPLTPAQKDYLAAMKDNAARLIELTAQASRLADCVDMGPQILDVRDLWQAAATAVGPEASRRLVGLDVLLPPKSCRVSADRTILAAVFQCVLLEVLFASPRDGRIRIEVALSHRNEQVVARIQASGGVPTGEDPAGRPAEQPGLMEAARDAIRMCHGEISAEKAAGRGQLVLVTLPVCPDTAAGRMPIHD